MIFFYRLIGLIDLLLRSKVVTDVILCGGDGVTKVKGFQRSRFAEIFPTSNQRAAFYCAFAAFIAIWQNSN